MSGNTSFVCGKVNPNVDEALLSKAIELNVKNSINKIRQSHIMNELEEEGKVAIIGD